MKINYFSEQQQDLAALFLGKSMYKSLPLTYLDIGCGGPIEKNNTFLLEENGWDGICIDIEDNLESFKELRKSPFYQLNTLEDDFLNVLDESFEHKYVSYISLDVDGSSLDTLKKIIDHDMRFAFMTFEHDYHYFATEERRELTLKENYAGWNHNDSLGRTKEQILSCKHASKAILQSCGYELLFENVCFYHENTGDFLHPWEDWWINPKCFDPAVRSFFSILSSKNLHFQDCVRRLETISSYVAPKDKESEQND